MGNKNSKLLDKWLVVGHALKDRRLSAGDHSVLWYICEKFDKVKGYAWPGFSLIKNEMGLSPSTAKRAVKKLESLGYITIVQRGYRSKSGTKGMSNRYSINWDLPKTSVTDDTSITNDTSPDATNESATHSNETSSTDDTALVSDLTKTSVTDDTALVSQMTPDTTYYSGYTSVNNRKVISGSGENQTLESRSDGAAPKGAPSCSSSLEKREKREQSRKERNGKKFIEEFWKHYPKAATNKHTVDQLLLTPEILKKQYSIKTAVSDYSRYVKWTKLKTELHGKTFEERFICDPINFLKKKRWEDDWFSKAGKAGNEYHAIKYKMNPSDKSIKPELLRSESKPKSNFNPTSKE